MPHSGNHCAFSTNCMPDAFSLKKKKRGREMANSMREKTRVKPFMKVSNFRFTKRRRIAPRSGTYIRVLSMGKESWFIGTYKITFIIR